MYPTMWRCPLLWNCVVAFALAGCSPSGSTQTIIPPRGTQDARSISVGGSTSVAMVSTPSTGFSWSLDEAQSAGLDHVTVHDKGFTRTDSGLVGAPGRRWWSITGRSPGRVTMRFVYQRAWERKNKPAKVRTIDLRVR